MYFISIRTLNWQLKKAIYSKSLTTEELKKVSEDIREKQKQLQKVIIAITVFVIILFLTFIVMGIMKGILFTPSMIFGIIAIIPIIYVVCYFTQIGILKMQYNRAIRKNYAESFEDLKV